MIPFPISGNDQCVLCYCREAEAAAVVSAAAAAAVAVAVAVAAAVHSRSIRQSRPGHGRVTFSGRRSAVPTARCRRQQTACAALTRTRRRGLTRRTRAAVRGGR